MRRYAAIGIALALAAAATATEQNDGGSGGDAPDDCDGTIVLSTNDARTGTLDPPGDAEDHYGLQVDEDDVGRPVNVTLSGDLHHLVLDVYTPQCGANVAPEHPACEAARCPPGHDRDAPGHDRCDGRGHAGECSDAHSGDGYVRFTPDAPGLYVVRVAVEPGSYHPPSPGKSGPPRDCTEICVESCHNFCDSPLAYAVETESRSTGDELLR